LTARQKTEAGRAWLSTLDERGNRAERRRARTGGREAGWAWDSDNTWAAEGAARRTGAPEAVGISQGTQHNEPRKVRLAVAPMSRVNDKADKSVSGKWVGRSLELVEKPTAAAAAGR
jgi:hypothetical protein